MMLLLIGDVSHDDFSVLGTHREDSIACLPMERYRSDRLSMSPQGRAGLDLADQISDRDRPRQRKQKMDVIGDGVSRKQIGPTTPDNAADVCVHITSPCVIDQWEALLCAENEMDQDVCK